MSAGGKRPTIARIWRGRVPRERADEYEKYNYDVASTISTATRSS
jgi:hypothetical protein